MNNIYELTTYRDGETLGKFMLSTYLASQYADVVEYCNHFLDGVAYDMAELCVIYPAVLIGTEITEPFMATLLETWPPLR